MATPAPAEKSLELYNDLLAIPVNERPEDAEKLLWQLRALCKSTPGNFPALVALIQGALMTGQRDEAAENLERAWGLRQGQEPQVVFTFAGHLVDIGQYGRAKTVLCELLAQPAIRSNAKHLNLAYQCAVPSGDVEWWREIMEISRDLGDTVDYEVWDRTVKDFDLSKYLPNHFEIVHGFVAAQQCAVIVHQYIGPTDHFCFDVLYYLPLDRKDRVELNFQIDQALCDHYEKLELEPAWYVDVINVSIAGYYPQLHSTRPVP